MLRTQHITVTAIAALLGLSGAASAGGYIAPVDDTPIVPAATLPAAAADWSGAYGGLNLGYVFGGDDVVGLEVLEEGETASRGTDLGQLDLSGPTIGGQVGYRWQRSNWVYGPELWGELGSVDATDSIDYTDVYDLDGVTIDLDLSGDYKSKMNNAIGLQFKTGYIVNPTTIVYGTAGLVRGDFEYSVTQEGVTSTRDYTANGYSLGLGAERKLGDRSSIFAEWQYRNFGKTDIDLSPSEGTEFLTKATPEHHLLKMGVNFSF